MHVNALCHEDEIWKRKSRRTSGSRDTDQDERKPTGKTMNLDKVTQMTVNPASHHQESVNVVPELEGTSGIQKCPWGAAALLYGPALPNPN